MKTVGFIPSKIVYILVFLSVYFLGRGCDDSSSSSCLSHPFAEAQVQSRPSSRSVQSELRQKHRTRRYKRVIKVGDSTGGHSSKMSMANVTCQFHPQPLDHFTPSSRGKTFLQRYCIYDGFMSNDGKNSDGTGGQDDAGDSPIFFYTGNESPIDEYVNNTGLMWELASKPHIGALVVFAEHRFEGESIPDFSNETLFSSLGAGTSSSSTSGNGCFTYLTSSQTLQDFASLLSYINPNHSRPVIAFGGSYGGMLSSWLRMKYPSAVAGAIASSAPVFGFPKTLGGDITKGSASTSSNTLRQDELQQTNNIPNEGTMDGGYHVVGNAIKMPKRNDFSDDENHCFDNLLATWPLIQYYGRSKEGRKVLSEEFRLCRSLRDENDASNLIDWAQSPWFDLAEGDYPYNSSYIPYALGEGLHELPAWPLQEACHGSSGLSRDLNVAIVGDRENIQLQMLYGERSTDGEEEDYLVLNVDWDHVESDQLSSGDYNHPVARRLLSAVRESVAIWFNVTKSLDCFDVVPAINANEDDNDDSIKNRHHHERDETTLNEGLLRLGRSKISRQTQSSVATQRPRAEDTVARHQHSSAPEMCLEKIQNETVWTTLVCNENLNLIMTYARGVNANRDFFWPPSHDREQHTYADTVSNRTEVEDDYESSCADPHHIYGYPDKNTVDPYSTYMDDYYGGLRIGYHSNIIFSNGLLDPWSAAGVYGEESSSTSTSNDSSSSSTLKKNICTIDMKDGEEIEYECSMVQNVTRDGSILAIILDLGAHHLDLMPSHEKDPSCARIARRIEEHYILKWIEEWKQGRQIHGGSTAHMHTSCDTMTS